MGASSLCTCGSPFLSGPLTHERAERLGTEPPDSLKGPLKHPAARGGETPLHASTCWGCTKPSGRFSERFTSALAPRSVFYVFGLRQLPYPRGSPFRVTLESLECSEERLKERLTSCCGYFSLHPAHWEVLQALTLQF